MSKTLYIVAGCNGAGKTTASFSILPNALQCREFVNADEIARGLSPFNVEKVAIQAGRLMIQRIEELLAEGEAFAIETTLATRSYVNLVKRAKKSGYSVQLIFFWLNSPELAIQRIAERVGNGGHNIPENVVRRRYVSGISNLFNLYIPIVDTWVIIDNSTQPRQMVANGSAGRQSIIYNETTFQKIQSYVREGD